MALFLIDLSLSDYILTFSLCFSSLRNFIFYVSSLWFSYVLLFKFGVRIYFKKLANFSLNLIPI